MYLLEVPLKYYPKTHPHLTSSSSSSNIFLPVIINFSFCIIRQNNANKNKYEMVHFFFMIFNNILRHQLLFFRLFSSSPLPLRYFTLRCTTAPPRGHFYPFSFSWRICFDTANSIYLYSALRISLEP